jgi:prolipoprotein diacylglyceryl transferase
VNLLASIPSPSTGVIDLGPIPLRGYAVAILIGIVVGVIVGQRRWEARGGAPGVVADIALWVVPFGIIGGRVYHVLTEWSDYFGEGADPVDALKIWQGGLGIWGAVVFGGIGAWIGCRRRGIPLPMWADAIAPGLALGQAIGRFGNWFNQELYGRPTDLPWALEIDPENRPAEYLDVATFHPTFLYEAIWCVLVAIAVVVVDKRLRLGHGRAFALYVALYTAGRGFIESLRVDEVAEVAGVRWNVWVSIAVFLGAVAYLVISSRLRPGREDPALADPRGERAAAEREAAQEPDAEGPDGDARSAEAEDGADSGREPESAGPDHPPER